MNRIHPYFAKRTAGVLLHVSSLPGGHGIGDFGPSARGFLDWLSSSGWSTWQVLPIGPLGKGDSPYSSPSSFAIEPLLLSLEDLASEGLLPRSAVRRERSHRSGRVNYREVRRFKEPRLRSAWLRFVERGGERRTSYRRFRERADFWLGDWCEWASANRGQEDSYHAFIQFALDRQWNRLQAQARRRGIRIFGDLPIFVPLESADVAGNRGLFQLDADGRPRMVTGVPPDCFSRDGQLWEHPHYRWAAHQRTGFEWWTRRLAIQFERFDMVRIDHFIGLHHAWHVPAGSPNARKGSWRRAPGRRLLEAVHARLGRTALVAEDLGAVTPAVTRLRDDFGLPGMTILQNAFGSDDDPGLPHHVAEHSVIYTGTHDNDTTRGWWRGLSAAARRRAAEYAGATADDPAQALVRCAMTSRARTAITPMQDLLGLGRTARMNIPGKASGNWRWRLEEGMLRKRDAHRMRRLAAVTGRLGGRVPKP